MGKKDLEVKEILSKQAPLSLNTYHSTREVITLDLYVLKTAADPFDTNEPCEAIHMDTVKAGKTFKGRKFGSSGFSCKRPKAS